ncbi:hypothetical protein PoB_004792800 [Plakobranchus ocellatus]|uniref:Uncharacterized protein n=1 Tax=Plakobranchus ocellatus TaxID=259542 RepID=A0AAV4BQM8_9GAST|nr:hypothetical protein PoB_004792800 [Plakobranchus ocellatus]
MLEHSLLLRSLLITNGQDKLADPHATVFQLGKTGEEDQYCLAASDSKSDQATKEKKKPDISINPIPHQLNLIKETRPQQTDYHTFGSFVSHDAGGGARTCDKMIPADLRADLLATVPQKLRSPYCRWYRHHSSNL